MTEIRAHPWYNGIGCDQYIEEQADLIRAVQGNVLVFYNGIPIRTIQRVEAVTRTKEIVKLNVSNRKLTGYIVESEEKQDTTSDSIPFQFRFREPGQQNLPITMADLQENNLMLSCVGFIVEDYTSDTNFAFQSINQIPTIRKVITRDDLQRRRLMTDENGVYTPEDAAVELARLIAVADVQQRTLVEDILRNLSEQAQQQTRGIGECSDSDEDLSDQARGIGDSDPTRGIDPGSDSLPPSTHPTMLFRSHSSTRLDTAMRLEGFGATGEWAASPPKVSEFMQTYTQFKSDSSPRYIIERILMLVKALNGTASLDRSNYVLQASITERNRTIRFQVEIRNNSVDQRVVTFRRLSGDPFGFGQFYTSVIMGETKNKGFTGLTSIMAV